MHLKPLKKTKIPSSEINHSSKSTKSSPNGFNRLPPPHLKLNQFSSPRTRAKLFSNIARRLDRCRVCATRCRFRERSQERRSSVGLKNDLLDAIQANRDHSGATTRFPCKTKHLLRFTNETFVMSHRSYEQVVNTSVNRLSELLRLKYVFPLSAVSIVSPSSRTVHANRIFEYYGLNREVSHRRSWVHVFLNFSAVYTLDFECTD